MKINRSKLLNALNTVSSAVSSNEVLEQSNCFVFQKNIVYGYNDEIAVIQPIELDIEGAIRANELLKFLNKIKTDEISLVNKDDQIVIKSKKTVAGFTLVKDITLPITDFTIPKKWKKLPESFSKAIKITSNCCAKTTNRPALYCVCLRDNKAIGSDGTQAAVYKFGDYSFKKDILIPYFATRELSNYNYKRYQIGDGFLYFKAKNGMILCSRFFETEYPDMTGFLKFKGNRVKFPQNVIDALDRADIFSERHSDNLSMVDIEIDNDLALIKSENDFGWVKDKIKVKYSDEKIHFAVNPKVMKDTLKKISKAIIGKNLIRFPSKTFDYIVAVIVNE